MEGAGGHVRAAMILLEAAGSAADQSSTGDAAAAQYSAALAKCALQVATLQAAVQQQPTSKAPSESATAQRDDAQRNAASYGHAGAAPPWEAGWESCKTSVEVARATVRSVTTPRTPRLTPRGNPWRPSMSQASAPPPTTRNQIYRTH